MAFQKEIGSQALREFFHELTIDDFTIKTLKGDDGAIEYTFILASEVDFSQKVEEVLLEIAEVVAITVTDDDDKKITIVEECDLLELAQKYFPQRVVWKFTLDDESKKVNAEFDLILSKSNRISFPSEGEKTLQHAPREQVVHFMVKVMCWCTSAMYRGVMGLMPIQMLTDQFFALDTAGYVQDTAEGLMWSHRESNKQFDLQAHYAKHLPKYVTFIQGVVNAIADGVDFSVNLEELENG